MKLIIFNFIKTKKYQFMVAHFSSSIFIQILECLLFLINKDI